jgi:hypothetical protein
MLKGMFRFLLPILVVVPLAAFAAGCKKAPERAAPTAPADAAPDFASTDADAWVNGAPTTLASLRGHVVVVEAWHPT